MPSVIKSVQFDGVVLPYTGTLNNGSVAQSQAKPDYEQLLAEAKEQAQQIIEAARAYKDEMIRAATQQMNEEREKLLAETRKEGLEIGRQEGEQLGRDAGFQSGYREGFQSGEEEVIRQNQGLVEQVGMTLEKLQQAREDVMENCREDMSELAFEIANTIVNQEIQLPESALLSMIDGALDRFREQEWLRVYLSETMGERLEQAEYSLSQRLAPLAKTVKVIPTKGFEDGDCIIEHAEGAIELSTGLQMEKIRSVIKW